MISLLMPTRGRPTLARRFLDSVALCTGRLDDVEVVTYVDDDDVDSHALGHDRVSVKRIIGASATMGEYNTACLDRAEGSIIVLVNDDVVIRTPRWDDHVRALDREYSDGVYLGYPNDLFKKRRIATFPVLSRATCELLVVPYPREYHGGLIDYHLFDVFQRLRRLTHDRIRYLADVVFEHCHYRTGKSAFDSTYRRRSRFGDDSTLIALRARRQVSAERLAAHIEGRSLPGLRPTSATEDSTLAAGLPWAAWDYGRVFLGDGDLPLAWRTFLFVWYCGRLLAGSKRGRES